MRILHTMLRVGDLQRSIDFYTGVMGMNLIRQQDYPEDRFTLAFVGYGDEQDNAVLELTYNYGTDHYDMGSAYGHIAIEVDDVAGVTEQLRAKGVNVICEPMTMNDGNISLSFVQDPDGYAIELIGKGWEKAFGQS